MLPLEVLAWGAIPVIGVCVFAGVRSRMAAARDARLGSLRSFRAAAESLRGQQSELVQRASREARNSAR